MVRSAIPVLVLSIVEVAHADNGGQCVARHCVCDGVGVTHGCDFDCAAFCSGGDGDSGGSSTGEGAHASGPPELRIFAAARVPIDRGVSTGITLAGQSPDTIKANARVGIGFEVTEKLDFPRWTGGFIEGSYFRHPVSSLGVDLGVIQGGALSFGYQIGRRIGERCGVQASASFGARVAYYTAGDSVTEPEASGLHALHVIGATRATTSCRAADWLWIDVGGGAYWAPTKASPNSSSAKDDIEYVEMDSLGLLAGLGLTIPF